MNVEFINNCFVDTETGEELKGDFNELSRSINYKLNTVLHFGKNKGKTVNEVIIDDPTYIYWMFDKKFNLSAEVRKASNQNTRRRMELKYGQQSNVKVYRDKLTLDPDTGKIVHEHELGLKEFKRDQDSRMFDKYPQLEDLCDDGLFPTFD